MVAWWCVPGWGHTESMSTPEQRARWQQRALWVTQLGLAEDDPVPVEAVEDLAAAVLTLLEELAVTARPEMPRD